MARNLTPRRQALADQIVAVLRSADGFPLSTGAVARSLGDRLVTFPEPPLPVEPRPECWPDDLEDPGPARHVVCQRCRVWHRQPVWRSYAPNDVRPILTRLARGGEVEKVVVDGARAHYWARQDTESAHG